MTAHFLDEIAVAPSSQLEAALRGHAPMLGDSVGAIIEYEFYRRHTRSELPPLSEHLDSPALQRISSVLDRHVHAPGGLSLQPIHSDAIRIPSALDGDPTWVAFVKRAESTAREAGLGDSIAAGLAGAIGEIADNVIQHSEATTTGVAAFARSDKGFEYVIADHGIGMLASLRRAPEFRSLRDDLEALPLAVTPGVSRHGRGVGYGYGYRAVFLPLRAASGSIRLRSGRGVLHMSGEGLRPDCGRCAQRPYQQGVVVTAKILHDM